MAIPTQATLTVGSSTIQNRMIALLNGIWYRGALTSTVSHTTARYRSLKLDTQIAGENLTESFSGDCLTGLDGVYDIRAKVSYPANTTGYRGLLLGVNPSATTVDATSDLTYGTTLEQAIAFGISGADNIVEVGPVRCRLVASDTVMLRAYQNSGSSLTLPTDGSKVFLQIAKVAE